jgi:hypothetical protein
MQGVKSKLTDPDLTTVRFLIPVELLLHLSFLARLQQWAEESHSVMFVEDWQGMTSQVMTSSKLQSQSQSLIL